MFKTLSEKQKRLLSYTALAVFGLFIIWLFIPGPVVVESAKVMRGPFEQRVIEDGKTKAKDIYSIYAPVKATLLRISYKAGDNVDEGEKLITMVPATSELLDVRAEQTLQALLESAKAGLKSKEVLAESAKAAYEIAQSDLARQAKLAPKGYVSESELEHKSADVKVRKKEYESAIYNVDVAKHEVERAEASLKRFKNELLPQIKSGNLLELSSPISGQIISVLRDSEGMVNAGTEIMQIADVKNLEVTVDLLSTDAVQIPDHARVWLTRWGGPKPLKGVVRLVEPGGYTKTSSLGVDEQRVNVVIDFETPYSERQGLGIGFQLDTEIVIHAEDNALQVPVGSLFRNGKNWAVFVIKYGRAKLKNIDITWRNSNYAVVRKGLSEGERVILYPGDRINDGTRVTS